eukprot:21302-Heterococcus_DN1.PRE.1
MYQLGRNTHKHTCPGFNSARLIYLKLQHHKDGTVVDSGTSYGTYGRASAQGQGHTGVSMAVECWKLTRVTAPYVTAVCRRGGSAAYSSRLAARPSTADSAAAPIFSVSELCVCDVSQWRSSAGRWQVSA